MGPAGGDELNLIRRAVNYGYPVVSNGDHYDGRPIPDPTPGGETDPVGPLSVVGAVGVDELGPLEVVGDRQRDPHGVVLRVGSMDAPEQILLDLNDLAGEYLRLGAWQPLVGRDRGTGFT